VRSMTRQGLQAAVPFESNWKTILECAALEVFEMMAGAHLELNPASTEEPHGEQTAMVGMAGALCGMTTLRCSRETAVKFASLMLGGDAASNPSTARDALGELCNMIAGNFKAKVSNLADHCMLSVPTVITGEDYSLETAEPTKGVTVALTFDGEPIWVALITHT
jgi:chemotaxis protein CheX